MSESTTIDQLEVKIVSDAKQASTGLSDFVKNLQKLEKNSSVSTAVKNLNSLSVALRTFNAISTPSHKINALTSGLKALKEVGSVSTIANSLTKLGTAMTSVGGLNLDGVDTKILDIVAAVRPLSELKAGGLSTMVNALSKLDKVTESLNDESIGKFAEKVKKLNEVLEPLSAKMTTIQTGLRGVNSSARSASGGVKKLGSDVNTTTLNMASMITVIRGVIDALRPVVDVLTESISQAIEWDGIAARFGRGFGESAPEVYEWIQRLNKEMGINVQQFMQYSSVYATMLTGFGVAMEDAGKMALGYTELTYDIWAGYNDVYKTFDEAAEAVKSAIAGEVEPVRRAGFTIIESTLEQTAANHGLEISLANATEAQKSYLRYLTLVDQAHAQSLVGSYARELNTAEGLMRTFSQQVKSLSQAFGSLFLPILVRVMPWLQALVSLLTEAVYWLGGLFGIEIQPVDWSGINAGAGAIGGVADSADDATDALGNATKAAKELKNATLGLDELNVISPPTNTASGGGTGVGGGGGSGFEGLDVDSLWDNAIFDQIQSQVDQIKEKIKGLLPVIGGIAAALAGWKILNFLDNLDDADAKLGKLKVPIENLAKGLAVAGITIAVGKLVWDFTGAYLENGNLGDLAKMLGTTVIGAGIAAWLAGPIGAGVVLAASGIISLVRLGIELKEGSVEITDPQALTTAIIGSLETILGGALIIDTLRGGKWLKAAGKALSAGLTKLFGTTSLSGIATSLVTSLENALAAVPGLLASIPVWGWIAAAVVALITGGIALALTDKDFTDIGYTVGHALGSALKKVGEFLGDAAEWIADLGKAIKDGFVSAFNWVMETFEFDSVWELIAAIFNPLEWIEKIIPKMIEVGAEILPGLWEGIKQGWDNMIENIKEFVDGFVQGWNDALGIESPSKVFAEIGKWCIKGLLSAFSITAIKDKVVSMWNKAKEWWTGNTTMEKVEIAVSLAKKGWTTVSGWIGKIPGVSQAVKLAKSGWKTVTEWIGKIPSVSQAVGLAKSGWKTVSGWIGKIPTLSQAISLAKSGWTTVKKWIGNIPTLSQAIKLAKSGWTSVKKWVGTIKTLSQGIKLAKSGWTSVKGWVGTIPAISAGIKLVKSGWTSVKSWLGNLNFNIGFKLPRIGVNWGKKTVLGFTISYPSSFYTYAKGGFPDMGELFVAREAGPEMVGKIGSRNAVANNQQIVEAISEGVYAAVVAAMKSSDGGSGQAVNVYLDGRQITATVEQRQHERGRTIMGKQVLAY